jgi:multiple sugar transport system ATP-binding protein
MAKLILKNVFKRYDDRKKGKGGKLSESFAVNDLTITCSDGEFVGILGPSGCGKTTTLRMIAGLEEITAGEIYIDDTLINNLHPKDRHIGLAFEDYALYPPLTVYDNIAFNLRAKNMDEENIKKEIMRIAPLMKVEDLLDMKPAALSGGQKQRVNITRALVRRPKLLLLDEPLSHLDGKMRQILRTELKRLHKEVGCTTIIVTHDQLEAMSLADKICIMKDGLLQQFGTPYEVYDDPVNVFVAGFIGEPPMNLNKVIITEEDNVLFFSFLESLVKVAVPAKYTKVLKLGMSVILGIRPNDLIIAEDGSPVKIAVFENLGDEKRIGIRIGEEYLTLITSDEKLYKMGDEIRFKVDEKKTHIFDLETGDKIRA